MTISALFQLFKKAGEKWLSDNCPRLGAALAFYTMFSMAPLLVVCTAIAGFVFGPEAARGEILLQANDLVGKEGGQALQAMLENANQPTAGVWATLMGIVIILVGAAGVFGELQAALNIIWQSPPRPDRGWLGLIYDRFLSFSMVLGTAFLLLVSLVVSTFLSAATARFQNPEFAVWGSMLNFLVSFFVITSLFAMIYRYLPDASIRWKDVWIGALFTSILFNVGKFGIGLYLGQSAISSAYGAAGSLAVLLTWVYYAAQVFLFGAELTALYAKNQGSEVFEHAPNAVSMPS